MKKTLSLMTVSLLTCTTIATASPSDTMNFSTLNQSDSHMLFGQNTHNVVTLNQDEMKNTEGEFWHIIAYVAIWGLSYANAPTHQNDIYHGPPIKRRGWFRFSW